MTSLFAIKKWMAETLMSDWLRNVWEIRPGGLSKIPSMLCLDAFHGHLTDAAREKIHSLASEFVVIPAGMTSVLQPLDVSIDKPFKGYVEEQYKKWFCESNRELTPTGKIKLAARHIVANWVLTAWKTIEGLMLVKSFNCFGWQRR